MGTWSLSEGKTVMIRPRLNIRHTIDRLLGAPSQIEVDTQSLYEKLTIDESTRVTELDTPI